VNRLHLKTLVFALIVVLSNAIGNTSLTWGLKHGAETLTFSPLSYIEAIFSPWVALGIVLLIVWLLTRMALLSWADLSYVLPVTALGYVVSAIMGHYFLAEKITPARWAGVILIFLGTGFVGIGHPQSGEQQ
jgi:drug/metabolite transporter (DMT)-like permease